MDTIVVIARYTAPDEFLADLARDKDAVERGLVHVTQAIRPNAMGQRLVAVHAGAIVGGRPMLLGREIGLLWGAQPQDEEVADESVRVQRQVEDAVTDLGLELRAGYLDVVQVTNRYPPT
jgi:hypothetical protein